MQLTTTQAARIMRKVCLEITRCKHHVRGFLVVNGKRILPIHCSFGSKDLPGGVPHRFRTSMKLTVPEFERMKRCDMGLEEYVGLLRDKGVVP